MPTASTTPSSGKLNVVATTTQIEALTKALAGDRIELIGLLGANVDPHEYEPTAGDVRKIATAQLVLRHGLNLDRWLDKLLADQNVKGRTVVVTTGVSVLTLDGDVDPHVWFSVPNAIVMVQNTTQALMGADPANAGYYAANSKRYQAELMNLDNYVLTQVRQVALERRKLVTTHDALGYFADRYGFQLVWSVIGGLSTESEPSPQQIGSLVQAIKAQHVPAIFVESSVNPKLTEQVAGEAGVKVVTALYVDTLGPPGGGADTYEGMMRYDTDAIVAALR